MISCTIVFIKWLRFRCQMHCKTDTDFVCLTLISTFMLVTTATRKNLANCFRLYKGAKPQCLLLSVYGLSKFLCDQKTVTPDIIYLAFYSYHFLLYPWVCLKFNFRNIFCLAAMWPIHHKRTYDVFWSHNESPAPENTFAKKNMISHCCWHGRSFAKWKQQLNNKCYEKLHLV